MVYYFGQSPKRKHWKRSSRLPPTSQAIPPCRPRRSAAADRRGGVRRDRGKAPPAAGPSRQAARGAAVPPADAALGQRHRDRSRHVLPCHRGHRQRRCLDRLVPEPGRRLLDVGGLSRRAGGAGDLRQRSARRAGLGSGPAASGPSNARAATASPACGPSPRAAGTRPGSAPTARSSQADGTPRLDANGRQIERTMLVPSSEVAVDRHLERRRPARHGERPVRAHRPFRARRPFDHARLRAEGTPRSRARSTACRR